VLDRITRPEDDRRLHSRNGQAVALGVDHPDRLLFTIKEAVYKAWFPVAGRWLGFTDAYVTLDPSRRRFEVAITVDGPIQAMAGRYTSVDGFVVAGVELPAPGTAPGT
jgi:4'-phosphopantetheinyl transferase EntD